MFTHFASSSRDSVSKRRRSSKREQVPARRSKKYETGSSRTKMYDSARSIATPKSQASKHQIDKTYDEQNVDANYEPVASFTDRSHRKSQKELKKYRKTQEADKKDSETGGPSDGLDKKDNSGWSSNYVKEDTAAR